MELQGASALVNRWAGGLARRPYALSQAGMHVVIADLPKTRPGAGEGDRRRRAFVPRTSPTRNRSGPRSTRRVSSGAEGVVAAHGGRPPKPRAWTR